MYEEDKVFLRLKCCECDNDECPIAQNIFPYTYDGSGRGCNRVVSEDVFAIYTHYFSEIIPMWKLLPQKLINEQYKKILDFLKKEVYNKNISCLYNHRGKVFVDKSDIKRFNKLILKELHDDLQ